MLVQILTVAAAIGCGVIGGVFFAFSSFVMRGLDLSAPPTGHRAMQAINEAAVRPPLMVVLFGTGLVALAAAVASVVERSAGSTGSAPWSVGGALMYIATAIVVTAVYHVPRNNALAALSPDQRDATERWNAYERRWTRWNHLRSAGSIAASLLFIVAALNP